MPEPLALFHPAARAWFAEAFGSPTRPQVLAWPAIAARESTLLLAPTGSGKTLAAFLSCIDRLMFEPVPETHRRCRVLYVSPLKALAVDVDRNLRAPIAGVARAALARGDRHHVPVVAVRTGDTPAAERARFRRNPADILITTPESLYLLLTSGSRDALRAIDTVIVDEIHALVPTKRGAHLALSLERLEALCGRPLQRIGLSATQRPLDEVARFLGGAARSARGEPRPVPGRRTRPEPDPAAEILHAASAHPPGLSSPAWRQVTILDAGATRTLELRVEVPVEDMARRATPPALSSSHDAPPPAGHSIWTAIHPRLLDLVRAHRSTLIFVNSRRLAERLAGALNDLAGEPLVRAHHGSLARPQRVEIEEALKAGQLRGLVATSSLELGIDMGAIDLVVQVAAPPSIASGTQRIGRAGHQVDAVSRGIVFPKYRGDLVACAAAARAIREGDVESTRFPRNPLDVLAQQVVALAAMDAWPVDRLFDLVRQAAPFATLGRAAFESVLDMLSGRYPSDEFAELRPRLTWDRLGGIVTAREGARRVAVINGGTIPDRGLYGVFLAGAGERPARVGDLDEEMVFESRVGDVFLLGASSWRIEEIRHDRVLVSPAPGQPGKMPFWKGDGPGRPLEFGRTIGALTRTLAALPAAAAIERLVTGYDLDPPAAENLVAYLAGQHAATRAIPDDATVVVERCRDELGEWRVCVLSPLGGRVLVPWALAATAKIRETTGLDVEVMWTDDGFVVRLPETDDPPGVSWLLPDPDDVERLVTAQLGSSALLAAKFRECAGRALLLPRRRAGQRTPLWQQRKRAHDLLSVASRHGSFPILLEAIRECLHDLFDLPALADTLRGIARRAIRLATADTTTPSPFAASLLFGYVASYIYDGDAPLAERRAQALTIDQAQLRELLGEAELRELLDAGVIDDAERELQHLGGHLPARSADSLHDLLLRIGDLAGDEIRARSAGDDWRTWVEALTTARRAVWLTVGGATRLVAVEDAARYRDAFDAPLPAGLPGTLLATVPFALDGLVLRFARTHGPFGTAELTARFGLARGHAEASLQRLTRSGRLLEGEFRPGRRFREWCEPGVLTLLRRRSLARLRKDVEPVDSAVLGRFVTAWHGVRKPRRGLDALLDAVEHLQGAPLAASLLETDILPARVDGYRPADLDTLIAAGEVTWAGVAPLGGHDGRLALYLADGLARLRRPPPEDAGVDGREAAILDALRREGARFFDALHHAAGGGFPGDTVDALWSLVWRGLITNDSLHALRAYTQPRPRARRGQTADQPFRSRRAAPPAGQGRWSLLQPPAAGTPAGTMPATRDLTAWSTAIARQLLTRHGIVTREVAAAEAVPGGFGSIHDIYRSMEERGQLRRGYFASGVTAMQFALPAALDLLRALREPPPAPETAMLAAADPANPYGSVIRWPDADSALPAASRGPTRSVGASVILVNGALGAYAGRGGRPLLSFLPAGEPDRSDTARAVATTLAAFAASDAGRESGLLIADINGAPAGAHPLAAALKEAGFVASASGFRVPRRAITLAAPPEAAQAGTGEPAAARPDAPRAPGRTRGALSSPFGVFRMDPRQRRS